MATVWLKNRCPMCKKPVEERGVLLALVRYTGENAYQSYGGRAWEGPTQLPVQEASGGAPPGMPARRPPRGPRPRGDRMTWGYPSKEACAVCGGHKNNQSEPRFGYVVCEDHQSVAPVDIKERPMPTKDRLRDLAQNQAQYDGMVMMLSVCKTQAELDQAAMLFVFDMNYDRGDISMALKFVKQQKGWQ